jgi:cytidylate kinase
MTVVAEFIVVTGPPGAGKSTVAELLSEQFERSALVAGDAFFGFLRRGSTAPWSPESHDQNTAVVEPAAAAAGRLARHCTIVYDGVVAPWFLRNFVKQSGVAWINYALLLPPLDVCLHRAATPNACRPRESATRASSNRRPDRQRAARTP